MIEFAHADDVVSASALLGFGGSLATGLLCWAAIIVALI
jgi:hypothetical protein